MGTSTSAILFFVSLMVVAFGQPASIPWLGLVAAACGFAMIFAVVSAIPSKSQRFWLGTLWFTVVQLIQLQWFASHPYTYIYAPYILLSLACGLQFGFLCLFLRPKIFETITGCLALAALWTLLEWSRIFPLSGFSWNPIGLTLASNDYARQFAAVGGVFALSFWVMFTNALALRATLTKVIPVAWIAAVVAPYLFGAAQMGLHTALDGDVPPRNFRALLVQTADTVEGTMSPLKPEFLIASVIEQWQQVLGTIHKHARPDESLDMIVLPEIFVTFGTYSFAYPATEVYRAFAKVCGPECLTSMPHLNTPYASISQTPHGPQVMVNNAYWSQAIANVFKTSVLAGLEDAEDDNTGCRNYFNAALLFHQQNDMELPDPPRYEKRVLVPLGEYIPFEFCRQLAARYRIASAFTHGTQAKIMQAGEVSFSPSICYEETFSDIVREGKTLGAHMLVNLTSDAWYPSSTLPLQHFEHARLRTVENGVPLIRACNNGITGAIDSYGRTIGVYGGDHPEEVEWTQGAIVVNVPLQNHWTLYSHTGDKLIAGVSAAILLYALARRRREL